jgi:hypothetical protein
VTLVVVIPHLRGNCSIIFLNRSCLELGFSLTACLIGAGSKITG